MGRQVLPLAVMALVLNGCTMIPRYTRPDPPVPSAWPESAAANAAAPAARPAADMGWRQYFTDPRLRSVIELALANNRDLRVAALNVQKAQALYRIQRSGLYPDIGVTGAGERYRLPERMSATGRAATVEQDSVTVGVASWEIDLFGRIRSLKARALEDYLATDQAKNAARISLVAAIGGSYLGLAADNDGLGLAQATLAAQQASFDLIRQSREAGVASDLDVSQAESQVDAAQADVAQFAGLVAVDRNALNLLVGTVVPAELLPAGLDSVAAFPGLRAEMPSDVLLHRPDVSMAEHQLKAANANIGAARAAFFPEITLTGGVGVMSTQLSSLFDSGTRTWSFAPQIVVPIFSGGGLRGNLDAAKLDREIAVAQYEKAIQTAFREASDALAQRSTLLAQRNAQESLVKALAETCRLSDARYQAGLDGYLGVLVAQRALFGAQEGLIGVRLAEQANLVTLYKVLGGGV